MCLITLQALEKKIAEWKLQVGEYKHQMLVMRETSEQKKTTLKKVIKSQKQRAEHLGKMVENLISTIKERVSNYTVGSVMGVLF